MVVLGFHEHDGYSFVVIVPGASLTLNRGMNQYHSLTLHREQSALIMNLTDAQLRSYRDLGFLVIPDCVSTAVVLALRGELSRIEANASANRVLEKDQRTVRSVYGVHSTNALCGRFVRHARMVRSATRILDSDVYVHQFKINAKRALTGDIWEWH